MPSIQSNDNENINGELGYVDSIDYLRADVLRDRHRTTRLLPSTVQVREERKFLL